MTEDFPGSDYAEPFPVQGKSFVDELHEARNRMVSLLAGAKRPQDRIPYPDTEILGAEVRRALGLFAREWHQSGSGYYYGSGSDIDAIVYSDFLLDTVRASIEVAGYTVHPASFYGGAEDDSFFTARCGHYNLIVYSDKRLFTGQVQASNVCRLMASMGWLNRDDHDAKDKVVAIHRLLRDGLWMHPGWTLAGEKE